MQVLSDEKRERILEAAGVLFASKPYHKVLLSEVAAAASVGKGTIYLYFPDKDALYVAAVSKGFAEMLEHLRPFVTRGDTPPVLVLERIIRELVGYGYKNPHLFELMRGENGEEAGRKHCLRHRDEVRELVETVLRRGVAMGQFHDPYPEITARLIPGLVRSSFIFQPMPLNEEGLCNHIMQFVRGALRCKDARRF
ncbi:MAG: TetR/AcrR family transcriptional regulator [Desulfovibrionaceae bacterium]